MRVIAAVRRTTLSARIALALVGSLMLAAGCGSSSKTATSPTPAKCAVTISAPSGVMDAKGGAGTATVSAQTECAWTASSQAAWITALTPAAGQGTAQVQFQVAGNPDPSSRQGDLLVNDQRVSIRQDGTPCTFELTASAVSLGASPASGTIIVTSAGGCTWTASAGPSWLSITSGAASSGTATVGYSAQANPATTSRSGILTIAGQAVTVTQAAAETPAPGPPQPGPPAPPCTYAIDPASLTLGAGAETNAIAIAAAAGCAWTAVSQVPWLTITSLAAGTGAGNITFASITNPGAARSGTVIIAGQTLAITQVGSCAAAITPASQSLGTGGGAGAPISVTTAPGCAWTAKSNAPWLTVATGASGNGSGTVTFTATANTGGARSGTILIAGQIFTATQGGSCAISINPTSESLPVGGGDGAPIDVTTSDGCAWTATSGATWLTIASGASGTGNGTVKFTAAANTGPSRTGTLTIGGQTFTATQGGSCAVTLNATSQSMGASGGAGTPITVTAAAGCPWTATSGDVWLTITGGASGNGNGTVAFTATANSGASRTGTLTIAGQTYTVTQTGTCAVTINPASQSMGAGGGAGNPITVTSAAGCAWAAASDVPWLTISTGATGSGGGTVTFTAAANSGPSRTGTLTIAGQTFTVTQAGTCAATLTPTSQSMGAAGGAGNPIAVAAANGCAWTAVSDVPWLTIATGATGNGNGTVTFTAAANSGPSRTGTLTIAGQTFTVTQAGTCAATLTPTSQSMGAAGGAGNPIAVAAANGCAWTAVSDVPWLTISTGATGNGNGTVAFTAAANSGPSRTGTLTIAGQTFTVTQAGTCAATLTPTSQSMGAAGGAGNPIAVAAANGCAWTAVSDVPWLTIATGATGNGNGTVTFTAAANSGPSRTGTLTIAGQTFTVTQAGTCAATLTPTSQSMGAAGGAGNPIAVAAANGCAWTAVSDVPWLTISTGATGNGNGTVTFTAAANSGPSRTGTLTIAGQTFTVTQAGTCAATLTPTSQSIGAAGGAGNPIAVTIAAGCAWTAVRDVPWLTIATGASGNGNGTVTFTAAANSGPSRTGTLTIAAQTFTVTQAGTCAATLTPTSQSMGAAGGAGNPITVTIATGCAWTAVRDVPWLTIATGASGNGNGTVTFTAAANTGASRMGTLTIAGQTFTVTQAGTCATTLDPTSQSLSAAGGPGTPITVTTANGCAWTATSGVSWLTILTGANGNGNGSVTYTALPNVGGPRSGNLTIAGQTFTVSQGGACIATFNPTALNLSRDSQTATVTVTIPAGCAWTATESATWITITSGASGTGNGSVVLDISRLMGGQGRTATITIAGLPFIVTQDND